MPTDCTEHVTRGGVNDPVNFFLIAAMTGKKAEKVVDVSSQYMVSLTINGVEVDFEHAVERFMTSLDENAQRKALEMLSGKCADIVGTLTSLENGIKRTVRKRLGVKFGEEED